MLGRNHLSFESTCIWIDTVTVPHCSMFKSSENIIFISSLHTAHEMSTCVKVRVSHCGDNEE